MTSDQADLSGPLHGYFVMIGNTQDEISLYKQSGNTITKIIDGVDGRVNLSIVNVRLKVTRDAEGSWELFSDIGITGTYISEGIAQDLTFFPQPILVFNAFTHPPDPMLFTLTISMCQEISMWTTSLLPLML